MVTRRPLIKCNNDLKQCFDRLMSHLVQLNQQSYGLPSNIAKILGDFLQQAIYRIKLQWASPSEVIVTLGNMESSELGKAVLCQCIRV